MSKKINILKIIKQLNAVKEYLRINPENKAFLSMKKELENIYNNYFNKK